MDTRLFDQVLEARHVLSPVVEKTPLLRNENLSDLFEAEVYLKREDLQAVRSYKVRGAYNKLSSLTEAEKAKGVVCASAGNHAQGLAWSCQRLNIQASIYMLVTTPAQKVRQVAFFGKGKPEILLLGDTFDDAYDHALAESDRSGRVFIHPFDDDKVIAGQGTIALEILEQSSSPIDLVLMPVGGGGLAAGMSTVFKKLSPSTHLIGVEPLGAASMTTSIHNGYNTTLDTLNKFVDGAAVKRVGEKTFVVCCANLDEMILVAEGKVCTTLLKLYNEEGMVLEPAGALAIAALDQCRDSIKGKRVVCVVSGSNNDISRTEEIRERSLLHEDLKHYFIIRFPQRAGALREFLTEVLGPKDDITYFRFSKKTNRENAPAIVGLELARSADKKHLFERMSRYGIGCEYLNDKPELFEYLI
jgi:threonine dehydratase